MMALFVSAVMASPVMANSEPKPEVNPETVLVKKEVGKPVLSNEKGALLFKQSNCTMCHAVDKKSVGPSLVSIAMKYKGDKSAIKRLEGVVRNGGKGDFGSAQMPSQSKLSDNTISELVTWVLSH